MDEKSWARVLYSWLEVDSEDGVVGSCVPGHDWAMAYAASESYVLVGPQQSMTLLKRVHIAGVECCETDCCEGEILQSRHVPNLSSISQMPLEIASSVSANASSIPPGTVGDKFRTAARVATVDWTAFNCEDMDAMSVVH